MITDFDNKNSTGVTIREVMIYLNIIWRQDLYIRIYWRKKNVEKVEIISRFLFNLLLICFLNFLSLKFTYFS
jgi:hypothetical protein